MMSVWVAIAVALFALTIAASLLVSAEDTEGGLVDYLAKSIRIGPAFVALGRDEPRSR
jgi:hypothetical protein